MDSLKDEIARMEKQLAQMRAKLKEQERLKLRAGKYVLSGDGDIRNFDASLGDMYAQTGATRESIALAKIASANMIERNRLEAYAHQLDPKWRADWSNLEQPKYCIVFNHYKNKYEVWVDHKFRYVGAVYMDKQACAKICDALNKGEIEL